MGPPRSPPRSLLDVQVKMAQLQWWYRTLDHLLLNRDSLEVASYITAADIVRFPAGPGDVRSDESVLRRPRTRVQGVACARDGVRVFVIDSNEHRVYEERRHSKTMNRAREALAESPNACSVKDN